jgi:hypothetical protein
VTVDHLVKNTKMHEHTAWERVLWEAAKSRISPIARARWRELVTRYRAWTRCAGTSCGTGGTVDHLDKNAVMHEHAAWEVVLSETAESRFSP